MTIKTSEAPYLTAAPFCLILFGPDIFTAISVGFLNVIVVGPRLFLLLCIH